MTSESNVFIAGVGFSPAPPGCSSARDSIAALISAATKALLDAGVTFDDVARGVTSMPGGTAFKAFDDAGITVEEVESGSEIHASFYLVRDRGARCVLMMAAEEVYLRRFDHCFGMSSCFR